tara:strand:- start:59 stop:349 length:291 start_codon:yes stop_codon:yes gene_type:complete
MIDLIQAILALDPNAKVAVNNIDAITWYDENPNNITKEQILAKYDELVEADKKIQYQRDRALAYDPIPEQLDQIYHDIDGWKAKIKSVKDKYPKPT